MLLGPWDKGGDGVGDCLTWSQALPAKTTPAARLARHSQATRKRTEVCNLVVDHWRQHTKVILHSLHFSLGHEFISDFACPHSK